MKLSRNPSSDAMGWEMATGTKMSSQNTTATKLQMRADQQMNLMMWGRDDEGDMEDL
jgi:hypothetical protein